MFKDNLIQRVESRHHELNVIEVSSPRRTSCKYSQGKNVLLWLHSFIVKLYWNLLNTPSQNKNNKILTARHIKTGFLSTYVTLCEVATTVICGNTKTSPQLNCHHLLSLMLMESQVKFRGPQRVSRASQQSSAAAFS